MAHVIFITAAGSSAGKTLLTGMCVSMLLAAGKRAIAIKPFCTGSHRDVDLLYRVQGGSVPKEVINPFFAAEPAAPLIAMRRKRKSITFNDVNRHIDALSRQCDWLLIEGAGGLLTPLGDGFDLEDLVGSRKSGVLVVARNRLGVIGHSRLVIRSLEKQPKRQIGLVLMGTAGEDLATRTNASILRELLQNLRIFALPYFGKQVTRSAVGVQGIAKKMEKTLAQIIRVASLSPALVTE